MTDLIVSELLSGRPFVAGLTCVRDGLCETYPLALSCFSGAEKLVAEYAAVVPRGRFSRFELHAQGGVLYACETELFCDSERELLVRIERDRPAFLTVSDCAFARALVGACALPALCANGVPVVYGAANGLLTMTAPCGGILSEDDRAIGTCGETETVFAASDGFAETTLRPLGERIAIPGTTLVAAALGTHIAPDGSVTFTPRGDGTATIGGRTIGLFGAQSYTAADGVVWAATADGFTDGETLIAAPTAHMTDYRIVMRSEPTAVVLYEDALAVFTRSGERLRWAGRFDRLAVNARWTFALGENGYVLFDETYEPCEPRLLGELIGASPAIVGLSGDWLYVSDGTYAQGFRYSLSDSTVREFLSADKGTVATNGFVWATATDSAVTVRCGTQCDTVAHGLGAIDRIVFVPDGLLLYGEGGTAVLQPRAWLAYDGGNGAQCYSAKSWTLRVGWEEKT